MRDRCCDGYDILLFLILHEKDGSRAPRRWRHNASGFVVQEDAKEVAMPRFRSLRFEFEQGAVRQGEQASATREHYHSLV